ncbi:helix-turn-helix domain-containing protein [Streptomyces sp. MS1.AVA.3]|uniref:helix-turn-helix domain-containing protein n=1 Tax=Streptomyces decoyicus TaxID=249567 RepID=UPI0030C1E89E
MSSASPYAHCTRAFAAAEETVAGYIRRRGLEQARLEQLTPAGRPNVAELSAHWQFADSSHFIRAFKSQYGQTPAQFARTTSGAQPGTGMPRRKRRNVVRSTGGDTTIFLQCSPAPGPNEDRHPDQDSRISRRSPLVVPV